MEKRERLNEIRKGKLPEEFVNKYNSLSSLIIRTTHQNICERPDAAELMEWIKDEIFYLQNEYVIITKKGSRLTRSNSDDLTLEQDYLVIDVNDNEGFDSTMVDSELTKSISCDTLYEGYDSDFEYAECPYIIDYSYQYLITSITS